MMRNRLNGTALWCAALLALVALGTAVSAGAKATAPTVKVFFGQGEQLVAVSRPGATVLLATLRAQVPRRYGPLAGVIKTQESYGVLLPTGSALVPTVNEALGAIIAQGSLTAISKRWMSADLSKLPVLR